MATDLQKKLIDIYESIRTICEDNDIRYYAGYGTAIGAVRHNGVIPWDDDIDIEMPWKDYLHFIDVAQKSLPGNLRIINGMDSDGVFIFCKVFDVGTTFFMSPVLEKPSQFTGVYVDVFPLIGAPKGLNKQRDFEKNMRILEDRLWKARVLSSGEDEERLVAEYVSMCGAYDFDSAEYVRGGFAPTSHSDGSIYPSKWYDSYEKMPFENTDIRVPVGFDKLLTAIYGDYMTPPKSEDRIAHSVDSLFDLEHSYRDYIDLLSNTKGVVRNFADFAVHSISSKNKIIHSQTEEANRLYAEIDKKNDEIRDLRDQAERLNQNIREVTSNFKIEESRNRELERSVMGVKASAKHFLKSVKKRFL